MAYNYGSSYSDSPSELAYDLRQRYAQIVGDHLVAVSTARINADYPKYYRLIRCLYTIVKHNIDNPIGKDKKNKRKTYKDYHKEATDAINKYPNEFLGKTHGAEGVANVENALFKLEQYILSKMKKSNMFGEKRDDSGL